MEYDIPANDEEGWLRQKYNEENLTQSEIGKIINLGQSSVSELLRDYGIKTPGKGKGNKITPDNTKYRNKSWLIKKYKEESKSSIEIANICSVSKRTILNWLDRHGIETRESKPPEPMFGEENPMWEGGVEQDFRLSNKWSKIRERVYKRDNYACQQCGSVGGEIHAHHIKPVSKGGEKYNMSNIEVLCPDCHYDEHS